MSNKLTLEHADEFERYVRKWQALLNLHDWRVERSPKKAGKGSMAEAHISAAARLAVYRLGASFGETPVTAHALESTACHELLHVLLMDLITADDDSRESAEHRIINTLERLLVPAKD